MHDYTEVAAAAFGRPLFQISSCGWDGVEETRTAPNDMEPMHEIPTVSSGPCGALTAARVRLERFYPRFPQWISTPTPHVGPPGG